MTHSVGATKPSVKQRGLFWTLHLHLVPHPDHLKTGQDREDWQRVVLLEGMVPALGWEPLTSRSQIDRPLMGALLDVLVAMDEGRATWDGQQFHDHHGSPWHDNDDNDGAF